MKVTKKTCCKLNKCYSIAPMMIDSKFHFLVAAEKKDPCYLFDAQGNQLETVWEAPGGVMTMVQVPGREDQFLATHAFYSPNDSADARIILATHKGENQWDINTLVSAPFVHRFGVLERNGVHYLLVCCLKSGHDYKDDWTKPGAVYAAQLPEELSGYNEANQLKLELVKDNMCHNHGYSCYVDHGVATGIVTCDEGVFQFVPPAAQEDSWTVKQLFDQPVSDAVVMDFDADGEPELGCISPFHGDQLYICHKDANGVYQPVWKHPDSLEMLHATWACNMMGKPVWVVGHRKGSRDLLLVHYEDNAYKVELIDRDCGSANVYHFVNDNKEDVLISANRETDEIAMYTISE